MSTEFRVPSSECEHLTGRLLALCRGETELPRAVENQYRQMWGFELLPDVAKPAADIVARDEVRSTPPPMPPLLERAWSFTSALARWSLGGFRRRTKREIGILAAICEGCEFFDGQSCRSCGCGCSREGVFLNKLAWRSEQCPEGKWPV